MRYSTWFGEFYTPWGDNDATNDNIINTWENFTEHILRTNENVLDFLRQEIQDVFYSFNTNYDFDKVVNARINTTTELEGV